MSFGSEFLVRPDLFPARLSGEGWGRESLTIDFVGGPYRFEDLGELQAAAVRERFAVLISRAEDAPTMITRVLRSPPEDFREIDTRGWSYTIDLRYETEIVRFAGWRLMAGLRVGAGGTETAEGALWTAVDRSPDFEGVFENYFRVATAYRLLTTGGTLLHSAAVVRNGGAYLFLGRSGQGKSTVARLSLDEGCAVLSDDCNAVLVESGTPRVERLPFAGDLGQTVELGGGLPLRAIVSLRQSDRTRLAPQPRAQAFARLLACTPYVNSDPERQAQLLPILEGLLARAPAYELEFTLDGGFWPLLDAVEPARC